MLGLSKTISPAQGKGTYKTTAILRYKRTVRMNDSNKASYFRNVYTSQSNKGRTTRWI